MRIAFFVLTFAVLTPAFAADRPSKANATGQVDKIVCRREVPIGSLIASRKVCLTKAQWERQAEAANEETRRVFDRQGRCNGLGSAC